MIPSPSQAVPSAQHQRHNHALASQESAAKDILLEAQVQSIGTRREERLQELLRYTYRGKVVEGLLMQSQERAAKANQPKGKLERDLANQKKQTRTGTLENISADERRRRDTDQTAQAISYN